MLYKKNSSKESIYYWDNIRFSLKLISIVIILILIFSIFSKKKNLKFK
jgi:hypothetical protein